MRVAYTCLLLFVTLLGCKSAPMTNAVVVKAESPDKKLLALLVERHYDAARMSNEFFLIVVPSGQSSEEAIAARHIGDSAALVATWASKVQLRWDSNEALIVICDSCGLEAINIAKKLNNVGATKVVYQGFPAHIANE